MSLNWNYAKNNAVFDVRKVYFKGLMLACALVTIGAAAGFMAFGGVGALIGGLLPVGIMVPIEGAAIVAGMSGFFGGLFTSKENEKNLPTIEDIYKKPLKSFEYALKDGMPNKKTEENSVDNNSFTEKVSCKAPENSLNLAR